MRFLAWQVGYLEWGSRTQDPSCSQALNLSHQHNCHAPPLGFPGISLDKESAYNAGDPGSIPGWGRFPGEGNSYPLQY